MDSYKSILQAHGYRMTPQRMAILNILGQAKSHLTPLEVYEQAEKMIPGLTEATVYRTLSFLTTQGLALAAHIGNGQLAYEIAHHNHHHLICRKCGETREVSHELLKTLYDQLRAETGYQVDGRHVTFFGLCPECQGTED
jgi:Fe2+ or Zn2+ uptake regulation protein